MRSLVKSILCGLYKYSGLAWTQERLRSLLGRDFLVVLLFHRVTDAIPEDGLTIGTQRFRRLCALLRRSFRVVPLAEVFDLVQQRKPLPRRTIAITFDDCYRDNLTAARILQEHRLPATFFLPTAYVGSDVVLPWDRNLPPLANLTWEDVRQLADMGFEIGSHSVTHANMACLSAVDALGELVESRVTIETEIHRPVRWFAYPYGGIEHGRSDLVSLAKQAGYEGCLSGFGGFVLPHAHDLLLPREAISSFSCPLNLELHLAGCLEWYYTLRRRFGLLNNNRNPSQSREILLSDPAAECAPVSR